MSIPLTGIGGFFTRHGAIISEFNRTAFFYGSALDAGFQTIWSQFASSDQAAVQGLPAAVSNFRNTAIPYEQALVSAGQTAVVLQVNDNVSVVPYTVSQAITLLAAQMKSTAQSINRPTLSTTVTPGGSNLGNAVVAGSTTNIYGDPLDSTLNETWTVKCTASGSTYSEPLSGVGQLSVLPTAWNWPQGSGATATMTITDAASTGLTTDGGFANWSGTGANTPVFWDILNGSPGVTVFKSAGGGLRTGTDAAQITSDGASATQLIQTVNVQPNTVYAINVFVKINTLSATGTFRIALTDGDGNILTDDAGNSLSYARNLNGQITTSYGAVTAFFSTPRLLPTTVRIQIGTSVAAISTRQVTMSLCGMIQGTPLYGPSGTGTSGPFLAAFSANNPSAMNDSYSVVFTNSLTTKSFAMGMERLYGLRNLGVYIPSNVSPTISDSLITN